MKQFSVVAVEQNKTFKVGVVMVKHPDGVDCMFEPDGELHHFTRASKQVHRIHDIGFAQKVLLAFGILKPVEQTPTMKVELLPHLDVVKISYKAGEAQPTNAQVNYDYNHSLDDANETFDADHDDEDKTDEE